jgi:hypothetical protein
MNMLCLNCGSPLCRAETLDVRGDDSRALSRFSRRQPISFFCSWPSNQPFSAETRDISLSGMRFETKERLQEGQIIKIDCALCRAVARVVHVKGTGDSWIVGVQFVTLRFEQLQGSFVSARI